MKNTCLLLVTLFFAAAVAIYGAKSRSTPTFTDCSGSIDGSCPTSNVTFNFSGLDPRDTYDFEISGPGGTDNAVITPDSQGIGSAGNYAFLVGSTGDVWTLTLIEVDNNKLNTVINTTFTLQ